jgi:hypothetical protein
VSAYLHVEGVQECLTQIECKKHKNVVEIYQKHKCNTSYMVTKELCKELDDCQVNINDYIACGQAQHNKELKSNYNVEHQDQCGQKKINILIRCDETH